MGGYFPTLPVPPGNGDKMALKHKTRLCCVSPQRRRSLSNLHFASGLDRLQWYSLDFSLTFGVAVISAAQTTEPLTFQPMSHYQIDCEPRLRLKMLLHRADLRKENATDVWPDRPKAHLHSRVCRGNSARRLRDQSRASSRGQTTGNSAAVFHL